MIRLNCQSDECGLKYKWKWQKGIFLEVKFLMLFPMSNTNSFCSTAHTHKKIPTAHQKKIERKMFIHAIEKLGWKWCLQNFELCYSFTLVHHSIGKVSAHSCFLALRCNNIAGADFFLHFILGYDRAITSISKFLSSFCNFSDLFHQWQHSMAENQ